jgi:hypothetical protein
MKVFNLILISLAASMPQPSPSSTENDQSAAAASDANIQSNAGNYPPAKNGDDLLKIKLALDLLKLLNVNLGINLGNVGSQGN